jgi:hypothetical protein
VTARACESGGGFKFQGLISSADSASRPGGRRENGRPMRLRAADLRQPPLACHAQLSDAITGRPCRAMPIPGSHRDPVETGSRTMRPARAALVAVGYTKAARKSSYRFCFRDRDHLPRHDQPDNKCDQSHSDGDCDAAPVVGKIRCTDATQCYDAVSTYPAPIPFPYLANDGTRQLRVRRQSFWDRWWLKIRESLAPLVCNIMRLAGGAASGDWRLSVV